MSARPVILSAPAKINLSLKILGKRADGYHNIESQVLICDLADRIIIDKNKKGLTITGAYQQPLQKQGGDHFIKKSLSLYQEATGKNYAPHITIEKNIPIGAGLGGGTSDAITLLDYLLTEQNDKITLAKKIGADGAVLMSHKIMAKNNLAKKPALFQVSGLGDEVRPLDDIMGLNNATILLIADLTPVSTQAVFQSWQPIEKKNSQWQNDLLAPAINLYPSLQKIADAIENLPHCLYRNMSGSGGCFYAIFQNQHRAGEAMERLKKNYWCHLTKPLLI